MGHSCHNKESMRDAPASGGGPLHGRFFKWADRLLQQRLKKAESGATLTKDDIKNYYSSRSGYDLHQFELEFDGDAEVFGGWAAFVKTEGEETVSRDVIAETILRKLRVYADLGHIPGRRTHHKNDRIDMKTYESAKAYIILSYR